jgi:hypothetical protein
VLVSSPVSAVEGHGRIEDVVRTVGPRSVVIEVFVYGMGPGYEVTGSFRGGRTYFNSDGVFTTAGPVQCRGFSYQVKSRKGVSVVSVALPRVCVAADALRAVRMHLLMRDPHETGAAIYLLLDSAEIPRARR